MEIRDSMLPIEDDDFWKNEINAIPQDLSPKGLMPSDIENIIATSADEIIGNLSKVTFDIFMFLSPKNHKYYMMKSGERYTEIGEMSLQEAMRTIKYKNRKK